MVIKDWRLTDQINYLKGVKLMHKVYQKWNSQWDHDHCEFCWNVFPDDNKNGYCTLNMYHWICEKCYQDFKELFEWELVD